MTKDMNMIEDDLSNHIYLEDEAGNNVRFELLDIIFHENREFLVLLSDEEAQKEESDVDILEVIPDPDNVELESYVAVEDDQLLDIVFQKFLEANKDIMDFV